MSTPTKVDQEIVRKIVVEEGAIGNPYASLEKLIEKIEDLKSHLVSLARTSDQFTTYGAIAKEVGIFTAHQGRVLGILGLHEDRLGNPPLPALVVQSDETMVNDGYFVMVEKSQGFDDYIPTFGNAKEEVWRNHVELVREKWTTDTT